MSSITESNNWNVAILTAVILILVFFWLYRFLFVYPEQFNEIGKMVTGKS